MRPGRLDRKIEFNLPDLEASLYFCSSHSPFPLSSPPTDRDSLFNNVRGVPIFYESMRAP